MMRIDRTVVLLFVVAAGVLAVECKAQNPATPKPVESRDAAQAMPVIELPGELDRVLRDYEIGWRNRDAEALAALFTEDGFILRPGHTAVRGRAEIAKAYAGSGGPLHLHAFEYATGDSVGYIIGGYSSAPERPDSGKYILGLRLLADGKWYITADMDNGNR